MFYPRPVVRILILSVLFSLSLAPAHAAQDPFPQYDAIGPNVSFWTKIFTHYSTTQAVVHDSVDLNIIYDVIDLEPASYPKARQINRDRMKQARKKIQRVLKRLAADPLNEKGDCRRVAALFGSRVDAYAYGRARSRVRCQIGQRERFQDGLVRSGAYIDEIRAILKFYDVPEDLAYLPHVESSFDPSAYSKIGAAGMWQFTRSTGKRFMTVDHVLDERRDPITATYAAARLLRENYAKLGSWPLAITAYNHGAAGMQRAKDAHGGYIDILTSYKSRSFKFASRNFYAEFLAARRVASDYQRYFGPLTLSVPLSVKSVSLDGFAAVNDLCRLFNISPKKLWALNPALQAPVFSGEKYIPKGYFLNLPAQDELPSLALSENTATLFKSAQKPSRYYTVRQGDTALKIALMHRVKLNDLILVNDLDRQATIYAQQTIRIPRSGESITSANKVQSSKGADNLVVRVAAADPTDTSSAITVPVTDSALEISKEAVDRRTVPDA